MAKTNRSLIKPDQQTLAILDEVPEQAIAVQHQVGIYSGARFFDNHPDKYKAVVWLLGQGVGKARIAQALSVSIHTVIAVAEREGETIALQKKQIASQARHGCALMVESIIQDVQDGRNIQPRDKAVIAGILKDVSAHMDGEAQIRIEAVISAPSHDQFNAELAKATGVEVLPTGFGGETPTQKGSAGGALAMPVDADFEELGDGSAGADPVDGDDLEGGQ